jgi:hypothetical protein
MAKERRKDFQIPESIVESLKTYYNHQVLANTTYRQYRETEPEKVYKWDKDGDESVFIKAAKEHNVGWERIAGTFFLYIPYYESRVCIQINCKEEIKHNGKLITVYPDKPPVETPKVKNGNGNRFSDIDLIMNEE